MRVLLILAVAFAASIFLVRYVVRVPRDYPFRTMLMLVAVTACMGIGGVLVWQGIRHGRVAAAHAVAERDRFLASRPADSLGAYVPPYPGAVAPATTQIRVPEGSAGVEGGRWALATPDAPARVVAHYRTSAAAGGWTVEMSAPEFLVLRRAVTTAGARGTERLRIQARRGQNGGRPATLIEHELTRRF